MSATGIRQPDVKPVAFLAAADFTGKRGYIVVCDTSGNAAIVASAGAKATGVLTDAPTASGRACSVACTGRVSCVAGSGGVTMGDLIKSASDGRGVPASLAVTNTNDGGSTTDPLIGSYVLGQALSSAAEGELFDILITHAGAVATTAA